MNTALSRVCADLTAEQLMTIRDFLTAIGDAATRAVDDLSQDTK